MIIDTNILIDFPIIASLHIYLPISVINELDNLKMNPRTSIDARVASRAVLSGLNAGNIIILNDQLAPTTDDDIVAHAKKLEVQLYSRDINVVIKAKAAGVECPSIEPLIQSLYTQPAIWSQTENDMPANGLCFNGKCWRMMDSRIVHYDDRTFKLQTKASIRHRNLEQSFVINTMFDPELLMNIYTGPAGTGKTFLTLACALKLIENGQYSKLLWAVPPVHVSGIDRYGFLPGDIEEKCRNYMGGLEDNCRKLGYTYDDLMMTGIIEVLPFTLLRGRSIDTCIVVLDEAQNASRFELKTMISRVEDTSKMVILGDLEQSDKAEPVNTGLYSIIDKVYNKYPFISVVNLTKTQRGKLAKLAGETL